MSNRETKYPPYLFNRRKLVLGSMSLTVFGCAAKKADWCEAPLVTNDGAFGTAEACAKTAANIEGPFYIKGAPARTDLTTFGDEGTVASFSGIVYGSGCAQGLSNAKIEFWQADPNGVYDNSSEEMRYRCHVTTDESGKYELRTRVPGRYLNGNAYRPQHIHVKVSSAEGVELLTTQLYFEGDPYIECDSFANTSLVIPFVKDEAGGLTASNVHFVV